MIDSARNIIRNIVNLNWTTKVLLLIFVFLLVFFRMYEIDRTARFTQDESSDLARMHQYYQDRKLTLVGPISNDNTKVFGSLTYYMLMPFAIAGDFSPVSPAYGTAFWGVLTALLMIGLIYKLNRQLLIPAMIFVLIWHPLLITSRWAWNPHLIPFWIALGILLYLKKKPWSLFASGISLSLAFHNHYLAIFATAAFVALAGYRFWLEGRLKIWALMVVGFLLPFSAFVIFDLRHPPGLFFGKYLRGSGTPHVDYPTLVDILGRLIDSWHTMGTTIVSHSPIAILVSLLILILLVVEIKRRSVQVFWALPFVTQVSVGIFLGEYQERYFIPGLVFLFVYLFYKRGNLLTKVLARVIILIITVSSLMSLPRTITETNYHPDTHSVHQVSKTIAEVVKNNDLNNSNVAVLASPDKSPLGHIYRDVLSIYGITFRAISEYDASENLFVVSTSNYQTVKEDDAVALVYFEDSELKDVFPMPDSDWVVYWFGY